MTHTKDPAARRAQTGPLELSCGEADNQDLKPNRAALQARMRRQRLVEHLHRLGPCPLGHFIREVEDAARVDVTHRLERYAEIDPEFVRALGGDKLPPRFLHALEGSEP
jgi:hypothetical protein